MMKAKNSWSSDLKSLDACFEILSLRESETPFSECILFYINISQVYCTFMCYLKENTTHVLLWKMQYASRL